MNIIPTRILLIDDHALFRKGVAQLVGMDPELQIVGEAGSGREGLALAQTLCPDVILIDLNMKEMDGVETVRAMKEAGIGARFIMLTVSDSEDDVVAALRAGAHGYLLKDMEPEDLCATIKKAARGGMVLGANLADNLARALVEDKPQAGTMPSDLTKREQEILNHLCAGMSNKAIARELNISDSTVKVHIKHLLRKFNLKSRLEIAVWAHAHSLQK
jgi:two-component system nitrate/nitrite response regulator NarL